MSFDLESSLITKILEDSDIRSVLRNKVTPEFFADEDLRDIYHWLCEKYQRRGKVPSLKLLQREFPDFEPVESDDDLLMLVDEVKQAKLYEDLAVALKEITDETKEDPALGFEKLRQKAGELSIIHSAHDDEDITKCTQEIMDEYEQLESGDGPVGIPYPWPYANKLTLGMQPGELIAFYARPKSLKTWLTLVIANNLHENFGWVPVYFSCEMPLKLIRRRLAALRAKVDYTVYREGRMTEVEKKAFRKSLEDLRESPPFMICKIKTRGQAALTEIKAKCEEYGADVAIVDGFYYLMTETNSNNFRVVTQGMKSIAESLQIPVLGSTQANRDGEKSKGDRADDVAFGDSLTQDCDQLFRIVRDPVHVERNEIMLTMPALREAKGGSFIINALPAYDFSEKHVLDLEEEKDALNDSDDGGIL